MQGCVVTPVVELPLTACFGEEVGHRERLVGSYLAYDVGIFFKVNAVYVGVVPVIGQIAVESVRLARGTEDDTRLLVALEDAVDELSVDGGKSAILRVVDIVVEPANGVVCPQSLMPCSMV